MSERIQKLIANAGYGSRRWVERLIEQGRVSLNNHDVKLGDKAVLNDGINLYAAAKKTASVGSISLRSTL